MYSSIFFVLLHAYVLGSILDTVDESPYPAFAFFIFLLNIVCLMIQYWAFQQHLAILKGKQK